LAVLAAVAGFGVSASFASAAFAVGRSAVLFDVTVLLLWNVGHVILP
jgi:hypothetical protein